jgi:hypothetical protein
VLILGLRSACVTLVLLAGTLASPCHVSLNESPSANELLHKVIENELRVQKADHSHWKYQAIAKVPGGTRKREVIETMDGEIDALLAIDGRPLTPAEERNEYEQIQRLVNDPDRQRKRQHDQAQDAQRTEHLLKILPDAVIATYGQRKGELIELNFKPNPNFRPSSHEDQVFHAMEGTIWLDTKENRLAEIEGHLTRSVRFGGGFLGHLDPGGEFHVRQSEVAPGHWEITLMRVEMKGRALFFKTISVHQDEMRSDFQRIPDNLTLAQGAAELRQQICSTTSNCRS